MGDARQKMVAVAVRLLDVFFLPLAKRAFTDNRQILGAKKLAFGDSLESASLMVDKCALRLDA